MLTVPSDKDRLLNVLPDKLRAYMNDFSKFMLLDLLSVSSALVCSDMMYWHGGEQEIATVKQSDMM